MAGIPATGVKLERILLHRVGKAVADFGLIREGDHLAVALSGGKDSFGLLRLLHLLKRRSPIRFEITAVTVHNGSEFFQSGLLEDYLRREAIPFHLERTDITRIVEEKRRPGSPYCSLCARLRRGALYGAAAALGCNKLALGHHLDDAAETLLMNLFFEGSIRSMPPKLLAENGRITVIRPLLYVTESMLADYAAESGFPLIDCGCWLCGTQDQERARMKALVRDVAERYPQVRRSVLSALGRVEARFLMDRSLYDFEKEELRRAPHEGN
ncbi:MAG: tRNA 2-thiocytidine(32) synthetase TtcA [Acidobacteriota bacterium]